MAPHVTYHYHTLPLRGQERDVAPHSHISLPHPTPYVGMSVTWNRSHLSIPHPTPHVGRCVT